MALFKSAFFVSLTCVSTLTTIITFIRFMQFISVQNVHIDESEDHVLYLFTIDACLVVLFMLQHSGQATSTHKAWMDHWGFSPVTRALYALVTSLILQILMSYWQPIYNYSFWIIDTEEAALLGVFFTILHIILWIILSIEVKILEPLYLLGIKQVQFHLKGWAPPHQFFPAPLRRLLSHMPHPGATCFVLILWLHPQMSFDRGILATVLTAYICCSMDVTESDYTYVQQYSEEKRVTYTVETEGY